MIRKLMTCVALLVIAIATAVAGELSDPAVTVNARFGSPSALPGVPSGLTLTVRNVGQRPSYYVANVVYDVTAANGPTFRAQDQRGVTVDPLVEFYEEPADVQTLAPGASRELHAPINVTMSGPLLFCDQRLMEPGVYTIRVGLESATDDAPLKRVPGWAARSDPFGVRTVWSNSVYFRVEDLRGDDQDALRLVRAAVEKTGGRFTACSWMSDAARTASLRLPEEHPNSVYTALSSDVNDAESYERHINRVVAAANAAPSAEWRDLFKLRAAALRVKQASVLRANDAARAELVEAAAAGALSVAESTGDNRIRQQARFILDSCANLRPKSSSP